MKLRNVAVSLMLAGVAVSAQASPAPTIGAFGFYTEGGFVAGTANCSGANVAACSFGWTNQDVDTPATGNPANTDTFRSLSWGNGGNDGSGNFANPLGAQSSLSVVHYSGALAVSTDPLANNWVTIDQLTHVNNIIWSGTALTSAKIYGNFNITPPGADIGDVDFFTLLETTNGTSCSGLNPLNSKCDDIFTVKPLNATATLFVLDGWAYDLSFRFNPGTAYVEDVIVDGEAAKRIYTREACAQFGGQGCGPNSAYAPGVSTVYTEARIIARQIPEPASLALVGLGLLGLGARRMKKAA